MYYVLIAIISILLFILRKRIIGGIVGVGALVFVIMLTVFLLDFFWLGVNNRGENRDIRNFQPTQELVEHYDGVVEDPVQKAKDIGEQAKDAGISANDTLLEAGNNLDERLGIQKDSSNNNLWGSGGKGSEGEQNQDLESNDTNVSEEEEHYGDNNIENVEDNNESGSESTNSESGVLPFDQLNRAESLWGLNAEDARFVRSASPFNLGEFSNGNITIEVLKEGVRLK